VRPAYISKKENIPFSAMMAVWLLERIFDGVFMVLLFSTALFFMPLGADSARGATLLVAVHEGAYGLLAFSALVVAFLVLFRLQTETLTRWLIRALGFLPGAWHRHLEHFLHSFSSGLTVIQNWKDFLASVATTVVLWAFNTTIFWWVLKSLRGSLDQITWLMGAVVLFCASLGLVIQFPGIGGGVQVGAILALTELFHVGVEEATGAAILVWVVIFVPCLLAGIVLLVREGLSFRKLEALAEEERAATVETL
ncbi:MAG TPA: lysylphosphatidylglycerol synthase transmembrane domain-containing protein, partial [Terriglobia bacterium]|nr:lysylphosphatidylglycerol synthase transmembrane domain-containing protein [Terriglobia bacterium]